MKKKELKELEAKKQALVDERYLFLGAVMNYQEDCKAVERVNKINGVKTEEGTYEKLLNRYDILKEMGMKTKYEEDDVMNRFWELVRYMIRSNKADKNFGDLVSSVGRDDLVIDSVIWNKEQLFMYVSFMKRFGYERIIYINGSTNALEVLTWLVSMGAKVTGVAEQKDYREKVEEMGLIVDITNVDIYGALCSTHAYEKRSVENCRYYSLENQKKIIQEVEEKYNNLLEVLGRNKQLS